MRRLAMGSIGFFAVLATSGGALAHGGVAVEQDACQLAIGPYLMHFTGYQPDASRSGFCEDIPNIGRTVIVLDFIDDVVRDMPIEFAIVRQATGGGGEETVLSRIPAQRYPSGSAAIEYAFTEAGSYAVVVSLKDHVGHRSTFPFVVGRSGMVLPFAMGAIVTIAGAVLLFFWVRQSRLRESAAR
jgi:hypothetical protein